MAKVSVIGAGSWGTALAVLLHKNAHHVTLWSYLEAEADMLKTKHEQADKLPGVKVSEDIYITTDLKEAVSNQEVVVLAVPSVAIRETARKCATFLKDGQIFVDVAKGIEENSLLTMTEVIQEELPNAEVAVLSGPSHAEEVGRQLPTTVVIGAKTKDIALYLQNIFMNETFRVYISSDMMGIELGGALKNVIALAAGIADGLGYGDNTKAALITRGIAEISRLGVAMGGKYETFNGLTCTGDLIVTCASVHSRNRKAGYLMGQGYTYKEAMKEVNMVVEGVYSAKAAIALGHKYNIALPIIEKINEILFEDMSAKEAVKELMLRDKTVEHSLVEWE